MSLLVLERLSKSYPAGIRNEVIFSDVSAKLELGEFVGVWGGKRSGKSTLLRILAGQERPDSGSVYFDGCDLERLSAKARAKLLRRGGISLVSPDWRPRRNLHAVDHVAFVLLSSDFSLPEARLAARDALERVGLSRCGDLRLRRLSPGELIRVSLARALVRSPRLLLVDEPMVCRSPSEGQELLKLLRELGEDKTLTLLVASEDPDALYGTDRIFRIGNGELRETMTGNVVLPFRRHRAIPC